MILRLMREESDEVCTHGRLWVNNRPECYTLEDVIREYPNKIPKRTAIWGDASYSVTIDYSPKYGRQMLHVLNVPMFEGIRIHSGNDADDTEGCILVGMKRFARSVGESRIALARLYEKVEVAIAGGESVSLIVVNPIVATPITT